MNLALIGFITVLLILILIISKKMSPLVALTVIPTIACIISGQIKSYGGFVVNGIKSISPTLCMFAFAIIFFNFLIDMGTFDSIINAMIRFAKNDPAKVMIATVIIAIIGHLDGAGSTTFILTIGAMLPIFKRMKLNSMYMIILIGLSAGIMNIVPWGGPTLRVMTVFEAGADVVFSPLLVPIVVGLVCTLILAVIFGKKEKKRLEAAGISMDEGGNESAAKEGGLKGPMLYINWILMIAAMFVMIKGILPAAVTMMMACVIAFILNARDKKTQDAAISKYAPVVMTTLSVGFATAVFTGVLNGGGFLDAMATSVASAIPESMGKYLPVIVGVLAFPMSFLFTPDAFYYGILPAMATASEAFGVAGLTIGRAALLGQMTVGFPFSGLNATSYMLSDMAGIEFGDFQRKGIPYGYAVSLIMVVSALLVRAI